MHPSVTTIDPNPAMNSPCIVVSQYQSSNRSMSLPNDGYIPSSTGWTLWLLSPQWSGRSSNPSSLPNCNVQPPRSSTHQDPFAHTTEHDIPSIMDQYRNLMFDFTFPETVDFRDLLSGQLAATHHSTMVAEHGWKLWELAEMLKRIPITSDNRMAVAKQITKIEGSIGEIITWVEEQRAQQLMQEAEKAY